MTRPAGPVGFEGRTRTTSGVLLALAACYCSSRPLREPRAESSTVHVQGPVSAFASTKEQSDGGVAIPKASQRLSSDPELARLIDAGACASPPTIEGVVVRHCVYGIPGFGETPKRDAREMPLLLVLDKPADLKVHEYDRIYECYHNIAMLQIVASDPEDKQTAGVQGKHVRISVAGYFSAINGHHHTRALIAVSSVDDSRPIRFDLRSAWARVKHDFIGVSCAGWPL